MWLNLAKISPELLVDVRARPDLLAAVFFGDDSELDGPAVDGGDHPLLAKLDPDDDIFGTDYRTLCAVAEAYAAVAGGSADVEDGESWLSKATHGAGELLDYEFCYGAAFVLDPVEVSAVAAGLAAEGWVEDDEDTLGAAFDDDENLGRFYAAATREGKAVVGGIS